MKVQVASLRYFGESGHMCRFIASVIVVGMLADSALAAPIGMSKSSNASKTQASIPSGQPAGVTIPDHGDWGAFVQVKGTNFASAESVRAFWYPNDDDSKAPLMKQTATYRGHKGKDEITIQIPTDPAKSGWPGDWAKGVLRIYLLMPGQKQMLFAARYTIGTVPAKSTIAQSRNIKSGTAPATNVTTPAISVIGSGPVSSVTTNVIAVTGAGPASNITTSAITVTGAGPVASVSTGMIAVTGSGPTSSVSTSPISVIGTNELIRRKIPPR
jgi:hypothetical protein